MTRTLTELNTMLEELEKRISAVGNAQNTFSQLVAVKEYVCKVQNLLIALNEKIENHITTCNTFDEQIENASTQISGLLSRVVTLEERIENLNGISDEQVQSLTSELAVLSGKINSFLGENTTTLQTLEDDISVLQNDLSATQEDLEFTNLEIDSINQVVGEHTTTITNLQTTQTNLQTTQTSQASQISANTSNIQKNASDISSLASTTSNHTETLQNLNTLTNEHTTNIQSLQNSQNSQDEQISNLTTRLNTAEGNISVLTNGIDVGGLEDRVIAVENKTKLYNCRVFCRKIVNDSTKAEIIFNFTDQVYISSMNMVLSKLISAEISASGYIENYLVYGVCKFGSDKLSFLTCEISQADNGNFTFKRNQNLIVPINDASWNFYAHSNPVQN